MRVEKKKAFAYKTLNSLHNSAASTGFNVITFQSPTLHHLLILYAKEKQRAVFFYPVRPVPCFYRF